MSEQDLLKELHIDREAREGSGRRWPWRLLVVLVAGGLAVGAYFALSSQALKVDIAVAEAPGVGTTAVLDATGGFALMCAIADKHREESVDQVMHRFARMGTIDLRIDFLRQGIGERFHAAARINRLGGRIASVQMRLENETGTLIATGAAAYVVS